MPDPTAQPSAEPVGGYAFEAALCQIESQSPFMRPADTRPGHATSFAEREVAALAARIRLLARLAGVGGQLRNDQARVLLATAARVAGELLAVFGPSAAKMASDPALSAAQRAAAATAATAARALAESIDDDRPGQAQRVSPQPAAGYGLWLS
ncbi:hypothetical protein [Blastochloris viridis]|uniref:Uncharacterized protein n=1 Tax=Blastochloris viridis TaxID=1079 RepID=A0A182CXN0_BLAVI|nr:hypothetical protein [Blastochloris viridis]BAR97950.1 hypothetical protein BV133_357 [Blastochloris viridis]